MFENGIPAAFIQYASEILADTNKGLSGNDVISTTVAYAVEYDINLPHPNFPTDAPNKRTVLYKNLMAFTPQQQFRIIKELCDHPSLLHKEDSRRKDLKIKLITRYAHFDPKDTASEINETLIEETKHWLKSFPEVLDLYSQALKKYEHGVFHRNLLDDLRLALEKLLRVIFRDEKSLENQIPNVGKYIKASGGSSEFSNMFGRLVDYYSKYNNTYVKHDDAVIEEEIEFLFEITSSFMKHLIRLNAKNG